MYNVAEEKDINFYCYFTIASLGILTGCMYDNELKHGIQFGDDVCEYTECEMPWNPKNDSCEGCPKLKEETLYYPPITDNILLNLILICGLDGLDLPLYYSEEHKDKILNWAILKSKDENIKQKIRDLLIGHLQEWSRM